MGRVSTGSLNALQGENPLPLALDAILPVIAGSSHRPCRRPSATLFCAADLEILCKTRLGVRFWRVPLGFPRWGQPPSLAVPRGVGQDSRDRMSERGGTILLLAGI